MPIQRSLKVSNEACQGSGTYKIGVSLRRIASDRFPLPFGLLLLAALFSGCNALPFSPQPAGSTFPPVEE